ncbi:MAG: signal peptidase II [Alphaproteobacteria bacterium]
MVPLRWGVGAAATALAVDQVVKALLLYGLGLRDFGAGENIPVLPFFDLVMVWNRGISYGLFQSEGVAGTVLLTVFSLAAIAALTWWLTRTDRRFPALGLGLIIGGAAGNVIDRILYGAVADFFHFHAFGYDWYVFNVADAAITIGVIALLADTFMPPRREKPGVKP